MHLLAYGSPALDRQTLPDIDGVIEQMKLSQSERDAELSALLQSPRPPSSHTAAASSRVLSSGAFQPWSTSTSTSTSATASIISSSSSSFAAATKPNKSKGERGVSGDYVASLSSSSEGEEEDEEEEGVEFAVPARASSRRQSGASSAKNKKVAESPAAAAKKTQTAVSSAAERSSSRKRQGGGLRAEATPVKVARTPSSSRKGR